MMASILANDIISNFFRNTVRNQIEIQWKKMGNSILQRRCQYKMETPETATPLGRLGEI